jgi:LysM repeat protein
MQIGAASGDTDAAWQVYANSLAESGDKALIDAISNMDANGQLPEELSAAWKRATASVTDDPVELSGLKASVDGDVEIDKDAWVESLNEKLGDLATTEEVTAEGATIKVEAGDCLWSIGNALGVDWQTIAEENGIESPYIIHAGDELKISMDTLTAEVDADAANDAIEQAMAALTAEGAEFTVAADGVKVDLTNVQVDSETAMAQIEAALGIESGALGSSGIAVETGASVTIPSDLVTVDTSGIETAVEQDQATGSTTMSTDVTVEASSVDATSAKEAADTATDAAFSETYDTTGSADVTIEQTNNADSVYDAVGSDLTSKFSSPYSLNASAVVTIAWSIANPSKSISFSGSGSGSVASVNAAFNASGGAVGQNGAELSWVGEEGLEYIIPTVPGRRGRGIALWEQAGQELGVLDSDGQISAHAGGGIVGPSGEVQADDSIIPLVPDDAKEEQQSIWSVTGQQLGAGTSEDSSDGNKGTYSVNAQSGQQNSGNNIEIKVDMSPVIKIEGDGMDEQKIFEIMLSRCREMADELSDEIAERMGKIFDNMPLVQEA